MIYRTRTKYKDWGHKVDMIIMDEAEYIPDLCIKTNVKVHI